MLAMGIRSILILPAVLSILFLFSGSGVYAGADGSDEFEPLPIKEGDLPESVKEDFTVESLRAQLEEDPSRSDLVFQLMVALMDAGDYNGALRLLEPLDELGDPLWRSQGHLLAGKIVKEKLEYDSPEQREELLKLALSQFTMAIELSYPYPTNLAAYWYLGDLQAELGLVDEAIETLSTYLAIKPHAYDARLRLAQIYARKGQVVRAKGHLLLLFVL